MPPGDYVRYRRLNLKPYQHQRLLKRLRELCLYIKIVIEVDRYHQLQHGCVIVRVPLTTGFHSYSSELKEALDQNSGHLTPVKSNKLYAEEGQRIHHVSKSDCTGILTYVWLSRRVLAYFLSNGNSQSRARPDDQQTTKKHCWDFAVTSKFPLSLKPKRQTRRQTGVAETIGKSRRLALTP